MKITKIQPSKKRGFLRIYIDGEFLTSLSEETVFKFSLKEDMEITEQQIPQLSKAVLIRRARERLLYSLDRRLHSQKELREKLARDYPPDVIAAAIEELEGLGLVDDEAFARAFCEHRALTLKKGPYAIKKELFFKGVDRQIVDRVVDEFFCDEDSEISAARALAQKYSSELDTQKGRARAFNALIRKGYSFDTANKVIREISEEIDEF